MTKLYRYGTEIDAGDLMSFVMGLTKAGIEFGYVLLEFYDRVVLERFDGGLLADEDSLNRGRAFGDEYELSFRRKQDRFAAALTAERPLDTGLCKRFRHGCLEIAYSRKDEPEFVLWGQYLDEKDGLSRWFDERIPRPLCYPVDGSPARVSLKEADYYDEEGRVLARRFIATTASNV